MKLRLFFFFLSLFVVHQPSAQTVIAFQGGEGNPDNNWGFFGSGANSEAIQQAQIAPNFRSSPTSLVAGGTDPSGGSCFAAGSGNGASINNHFIFDPVDLQDHIGLEKSLKFWYGNRIPNCNGPGWDNNEDLRFRPILDGEPQPWQTLVVGGGDISLNINNNSFTYNIPPCTETFAFELSIFLNRRDEFLMIDDISLTVFGEQQEVSVNAGSGQIGCAGDNFVLGATSIGPVDAYLWSGGQGTFSDPSSLFSDYQSGEGESGLVELTLTAFDECGNEWSDTVIIEVEESPENSEITSSLGTVLCPGEEALLSASGADDYLWSTGDTDPEITVSESGTYSVELSNNCGTALLSIDLQDGDTAGANINSEEGEELCPDAELTLIASGGQSYLWSNGEESASIVVNEAGTYTVEAFTTCGSSSDSITIQEQSLPDAAVISSSDGFLCAGGESLLTASGGSSYLWADGQTSPEISITEPGTYSVEVTNICGSVSISIDIEGLDLPDISIVSDTDGLICEGGSSTLTASGGDSFLWSTGEITASITVSELGVYSVEASNFCGSNEESIELTAGELPEGEISSSEGLVICSGVPTLLTASGGQNYLWENGASGPEITVDEPGEYSVTVSTACGSEQLSIFLEEGQAEEVFTEMLLCPDAELELPGAEIATAPGTYSYLMSVSNACDSLFITEVIGLEALTAGEVEVDCNYADESYTLSIEISGGDPESYVAMGIEGSFENGSFVSAPLPAGQAYNFTLSDANECTVFNFEGQEACICPAQASIEGPPAICIGDSTTLQLNFEGIGPFSFALSDGANEENYSSDGPEWELEVSPEQSTTFTITFVSDTQCEGLAAGSHSIEVELPPNGGGTHQEALCRDAESLDLSDFLAEDATAGGQWTAPNGQSIEALLNPASALSGTYLYLAEGNLCASDTGRVMLTLLQNPQAQLSPGLYSLCQLDAIELPLSLEGEGPFILSYSLDGIEQDALWLEDQDDAYILAQSTGTYSLLGLTNLQCEGSASGSATVNQQSSQSAAFRYRYLSDEAAHRFEASDIRAGTQYFWSVYRGSSPSNEHLVFQGSGERFTLPNHLAYDGGSFLVCLKILTPTLCHNEECSRISLDRPRTFFMPNAFSPNADGLNDAFGPVMEGYDDHSYEMMVFDRHGSVIFRTQDPKTFWYGRDAGGSHYVPPGIYVWKAVLRSHTVGDVERFEGFITVLR